jgi:hypothetical protein
MELAVKTIRLVALALSASCAAALAGISGAQMSAKAWWS